MLYMETNGLKNYKKVMSKGTVPLFLTNAYEVIEGPSYWAIEIAKSGSKSEDTLKQYTTSLYKFLQWLDDESDSEEYQGSIAWQYVDGDVIDAYIADLINDRDEHGRPNDKSIEVYISRLAYFYKWARENGYVHYWDMDQQKVTLTTKRIGRMVNEKIELERRPVKLQSGAPTEVDKEREKFLRKEELPAIYRSFEDIVYRLITHIFWETGLRPKELFQLPYMGIGLNVGLKRYRDEELENLKESINFEFESKGKRRSIPFPPDLWAYICRVWMPFRVERAAKYKKNYGVMPPNSVLFLSEDGRIVTRKMLRDNFNKAAAKNICPVDKLTPYKLRHTFATYFVLDRLKALNLLGKEYAYNSVIDTELREWMGHNDIETTYKYYVHLCNRYFGEGLLPMLEREDNKKLLNAILNM